MTGKVMQSLFEGSIEVGPSSSVDMQVFSSCMLDALEYPLWGTSVADSVLQPASAATSGSSYFSGTT